MTPDPTRSCGPYKPVKAAQGAQQAQRGGSMPPETGPCLLRSAEARELAEMGQTKGTICTGHTICS